MRSSDQHNELDLAEYVRRHRPSKLAGIAHLESADWVTYELLRLGGEDEA